MQPRLQRIKGKTPVQLDDQFAVDDKSLERRVEQRRHDFGKKAAQRRARFSFQLDRAALLERQAAKAVPFRLELPSARFVRKRFRRSRLHRRGGEPQARQIRRFACSRRSGAHPIISRKVPLSAHPCSPLTRPTAPKTAGEGVAQRTQGAQGSKAQISTARLFADAAGPSAAAEKIFSPREHRQRGGVTDRSGEHQDRERFVAGFVPYCGAAPVPGALHWKLDPVLISALLILAFANLAFAKSRGAPKTDLAACLSGWLLLSLAFISPLCNLSVALFSARVTQHMAITLVAAPLIARGLAPARPGRFPCFRMGGHVRLRCDLLDLA